MSTFLAIDMGAESGRVVRGVISNGKIRIEECARFVNGMVRISGHWHWNVIRLYEEIKTALRAEAWRGGKLSGIGIDTWGIDFALLAADGSLLGTPVAYRDSRTDGMMRRFHEEVVSRGEIYRRTGIQFIEFNTLYQLFAMSATDSPILRAAHDFLMIPDLFMYFLTDEKTSEFTNATTTQILNVNTGVWDYDLLENAGVNADIMCPIITPGTTVAPLSLDTCEDTGLGPIPVIAPATHDTGSAVAAVPATGENWAYISSGTWSLMGVETQSPITSYEALDCNFTNEGGVEGRNRFLKNIMGLWLIQRCRAESGIDDYATLTASAATAPPFASFIDPDDKRFLNPPSMFQSIASYCEATGQTVPRDTPAFVRCALESLALRYRETLDELRLMPGIQIDTLHIVGGGSKNSLLCQMTANACNLPVIAGPGEATAIGNIIVQALAVEIFPTLDDARTAIRNSFPLTDYTPRDTAAWEAARAEYCRVVAITRCTM